MSKKLILSVGSAALLLAACETTPPPWANKEEKVVRTAEAMPKVNADGMICERREQIGEIIPRKVCMTPEQWERHREAGQDAVSSIQRSSLRTAAPGQGT